MANIVGIGANVYDTLILAKTYPAEDSKMKAENVKVCGGGPCATGLVAASKLGESTAFLGAASDDGASAFLCSDFEKYGVSTEYMPRVPGYRAFSSYILLSADTVSRTCVFDRGNIPTLSLSDKQVQAIKDAKILMVDGNSIDTAADAAVIAKGSGTKVLYDAGGLYDGIEKLLTLTDILIPSEEFALKHTGKDNVEDAAKILYGKYSPEVVVITQGKKGGVLYDGKEFREYPAFSVDAVDSNGAGDVFHGAFAYAVCRGFDYYTACLFSSAVSAIKCTKIGAREGVPGYDETIKFLKERGISV